MHDRAGPLLTPVRRSAAPDRSRRTTIDAAGIARERKYRLRRGAPRYSLDRDWDGRWAGLALPIASDYAGSRCLATLWSRTTDCAVESKKRETTASSM